MNKLHFLVCANLAIELRYVLKHYEITDADVIILDSDCNKPTLGGDNILDIVKGLGTPDLSNICVIGSVCLQNDLLESHSGIILHKMDNCFEVLVNKSILTKYLAQGYYIITSSWLRNSWASISKWGFDADTIKQFFKESATKILFLDTAIDREQGAQIDEVAAYMGLDYETLEVGLDYFGNFIRGIILQWRYDTEKRFQNTNLARLTRQAADYAVVFDQLGSLTALKSEREIVHSIIHLFNLLFSAQSIVYLPLFDGKAGELICYPPHAVSELPENLVSWMKSDEQGRDIFINLTFMAEEIGMFRLKDVAFPRYISHYKQLSGFLSSICALGISNARKYSCVQEQEKQLSELIKQKDKLFSVIAHDLRGPVGNFIGLTDFMHNSIQASADDEFKELSGLMYKEAKNLFELLQNLLEWSMFQGKKSSYKPDRVLFGTVAEKAIKTINTAVLEKQQQLVRDYPPELTVLADLPMLSSILRNLLFNAVKFTPVEGTITLSAQQITPDEVEISVADTGMGIPDELREILFRVGENVSRAGTEGESSTGLGLIICNDFVVAHGSQIIVQSKEGVGTKLSFSLHS